MRKLKMKKRILSVGLAVCMMCSVFVGVKPMVVYAAAKYEPLTVSNGFNYDVICDTGETWSDTESLDQACDTKSGKANCACLYTKSKYSTGGLPANGEIDSMRTSGLKWKLGSYIDKNALKLGYNHSGTLTFSQIGCYQKVYILSLAGGLGKGNSATLTTTITYTDGTTSTSQFTVYDWWDSNNYATYIYGRYSGSSYDGSTTGAPYFVQSAMNVDTTKLIKSISFKNSTSGMYLSILGVTGLTADVDVPNPNILDVSTNEFLIDWEPADGAASYRVDVSLNSNFTEMLSSYNNKVVSDTSCVVSGLNRNTTYYYRVRSANRSGAQSASSASKSVTTFKAEVIYDDNGGIGGSKRTDLNASWQLPASVAVPTRKGYVFNGYYTSLINGIRYFDAAGNRVYNDAFATNCASRMTVHAQWIINSSTLTIDTNGGVVEGETSYTRKYNESVEIKDPVYEGDERAFLGWTLLDANGNVSNNGTMVKGAGYTTFLFGPESINVTLKAIWSAPNGSRIEVTNDVTQTVTAKNLERMYYHEVTDNDKGLTAADLVAENREVVLTVGKIEVSEEDETHNTVAPIEELLVDSSNESLTYYDISVKKIINNVTTNLTELPEPVIIEIQLTGELVDRTGYSVYRIHEGVAERMSSSRSSTEYYEVNGDILTIYTRKFSTYAITASKSVIGEYAEAELDDTNNFAATDVQGKYVDSTGTRVYKVDVEWGAMKFVFNKHQKWNPDNHSYNDEIKIELDESAYVDGNNEIVISNHSNADVRVGMSVIEKDMDGVEIYLNQENSNDSNEAVNMYLNKVADASGMATAEQVRAYVRLDEGMLNAAGLSELTADGKTNVFQQIARIVITIEAVQDSETTPLYMGSGD